MVVKGLFLYIPLADSMKNVAFCLTVFNLLLLVRFMDFKCPHHHTSLDAGRTQTQVYHT